MTSGMNDKRLCVGQTDIEDLGEERRTEVPNFSRLVISMFQQAIRAGSAQYLVPSDTYFFLIDKGSGNVDFVYADFDMTAYRSEERDTRSPEKQNLIYALNVLISFLSRNITEPERYENELELIYSEYLKGYSNVTELFREGRRYMSVGREKRSRRVGNNK